MLAVYTTTEHRDRDPKKMSAQFTCGGQEIPFSMSKFGDMGGSGPHSWACELGPLALSNIIRECLLTYLHRADTNRSLLQNMQNATVKRRTERAILVTPHFFILLSRFYLL